MPGLHAPIRPCSCSATVTAKQESAVRNALNQSAFRCESMPKSRSCVASPSVIHERFVFTEKKMLPIMNIDRLIVQWERGDRVRKDTSPQSRGYESETCGEMLHQSRGTALA